MHLDNVDLSSSSGPNTFAGRLAKKLFELGHEASLEAKGADASLVFIEPSGAPLAPTVAQRLDGIWFRPQDFHTKNVGIKGLYDRAGAVVFQSQFDKEMVERWWGSNEEKQRLSRVISNGTDLKPVTSLTIPKLIEMRATYDRIYACSSNWHPQKRLGANVQLFEHLRKQHPNSCLIVLGSNPDYRATGQNVFYAGSVVPEVYSQVYSAADWLLHLAWLDHCPNVVIDALAQGTPVACSEAGGTKELIGHGAYGLVLRERAPYSYELADYDNPPDIDVTQVAYLPTRQELDFSGIPSTDIDHVAREYVELLDSLVKQRLSRTPAP